MMSLIEESVGWTFMSTDVMVRKAVDMNVHPTGLYEFI